MASAGPVLTAELANVVRERLAPITKEWETAVNAQTSGQPVQASSFIPAGVVLSTKPTIAVTVQNGSVVLSGSVPSNEARQSIVGAVANFQPRPLRIEASNLTVRP